MKFTDALNDYLDQKRRVDGLKNGFGGYGFSDVFYRESADLEKSEAALNDFFDKDKS